MLQGSQWARGRQREPRAAPRAGPRGEAGRGRWQRGNELSETRRRRGKVQCHGNQGSEQVHPGRGGCRSIRAGREGEWEAQGHLSSLGRPALSTFSRLVSLECRGVGARGRGFQGSGGSGPDRPLPDLAEEGRRVVARRGGGTGARVGWQAPGRAWEEAVEEQEGGHVVGVHPAGQGESEHESAATERSQ